MGRAVFFKNTQKMGNKMAYIDKLIQYRSEIFLEAAKHDFTELSVVVHDIEDDFSATVMAGKVPAEEYQHHYKELNSYLKNRLSDLGIWLHNKNGLEEFARRDPQVYHLSQYMLDTAIPLGALTDEPALLQFSRQKVQSELSRLMQDSDKIREKARRHGCSHITVNVGHHDDRVVLIVTADMATSAAKEWLTEYLQSTVSVQNPIVFSQHSVDKDPTLMKQYAAVSSSAIPLRDLSKAGIATIMAPLKRDKEHASHTETVEKNGSEAPVKTANGATPSNKRGHDGPGMTPHTKCQKSNHSERASHQRLENGGREVF